MTFVASCDVENKIAFMILVLFVVSPLCLPHWLCGVVDKDTWVMQQTV